MGHTHLENGLQAQKPPSLGQVGFVNVVLSLLDSLCFSKAARVSFPGNNLILN